MDERQRLLLSVMEELEVRGYTCSESCLLGHTCLDLFARREEELLIVKVIINIDSITVSQSKELLKIASLLEGSSLLVGKRRRLGALEEGVAYSRGGVYAVSLETFLRALEGSQPYAGSQRGGYFVELDPGKLLELRRSARMSRREVAELAGITPRILYDYEKARSRASRRVARRLEEIFSTSLSEGIDLFTEPEYPDESRELEYSPFAKLSSLGFGVYPVRRAPLSGLVREGEKSEVLLTRRLSSPASFAKPKITLLKSFARTARTRAFLVSRKSERNIQGLPHIGEKEFEELDEAEQFFNMLEER